MPKNALKELRIYRTCIISSTGGDAVHKRSDNREALCSMCSGSPEMLVLGKSWKTRSIMARKKLWRDQ